MEIIEIMNLKTIWIAVLITCIGLTPIKLFVGIVHPMGGTGVYLFVKKYPTINNEWILGEENSKNKELHKGKWYQEGKYTIIAKGENGVVGQSILRILSRIWWIATVALIVMLPLNLIHRKKRVVITNIFL